MIAPHETFITAPMVYYLTVLFLILGMTYNLVSETTEFAKNVHCVFMVRVYSTENFIVGQ